MTDSPTPRPSGKPSRVGPGSQFDRGTLVASAILVIGAIVLGVAAVAALTDPGPPKPASETPVDATPPIIPRPNSGQAPQDSGDRGGWEQLTLLGLIIVAVGGITLVVARGGGAKARANRAAWQQAAQADHDGALD